MKSESRTAKCVWNITSVNATAVKGYIYIYLFQGFYTWWEKARLESMSVNHEVRDVLPSYIPVKIFTCFSAAFQLARQQHTWVTYLLFFPTHFTRCKSRACVYLWSKHGICWCYSCSVININCIYAHFRRKTKERDKDIGHGMWKVCQPGLLRRWWRREREREKKITTRKRKNGNKYTGKKR